MSSLLRRLDAAQGRAPCDLIFRNVTWLDVFSCSWHTGDVAIADGVIVALEPGLQAIREIDGRGKFLVPGFIDAHVNIESSLLIPENFSSTVLPRGTTTVIADPHEIANVIGVEGIRYFLRAAETLPLDLRVMLPSCVPATGMETNGAGVLGAKDLLPLKDHPKTLGLAEMMNVPGVLHGDPIVHEKLQAFSDRPLDGHAPLLRGRELSAYAACGISCCHESSQLPEAEEKLTKGISVWIREGSVAKDLHTLLPLVKLATSTSVGFCTDDRNPLDIAREGHIDWLVREAIRGGVAPEVAYRASSWSVARHYGLDRGPDRKGAVAPGWRADLLLLDDVRQVSIREVFCRGIPLPEVSTPTISATSFPNTVRAAAPAPKDLEGPAGHVHVIGVEEGKIITHHHTLPHNAPGVARLSVLERYGHGSRPANGYVKGFGDNFRGAIASSVGHDSHNLICVGSDTHDMTLAFQSLIRSGGGFCVVHNGAVMAELALPFGGLMTPLSADRVEKSLRDLHAASHAAGCSLAEPFLQLAFLSLPVIPHLKLTDKGLVDVGQFRIIPVAV